MSQGISCKCGEQKKPVAKRRWVVLQRRCNYSAFNGYHWTPSDYSCVQCHCCGTVWRTKASYVALLPDGSNKYDIEADAAAAATAFDELDDPATPLNKAHPVPSIKRE